MTAAARHEYAVVRGEDAPARPRVSAPVQRRWVAVDHPQWIQAHAPTLVTLDDRLLAAWFAGTHEGAADTRIWLAVREVDGPWSPPRVVADGSEAHWNPVLAVGPDRAVWLFYRRGPHISRWRTWVRRSFDAGVTWTEPAELVPGDIGGRGPVKNPPLLLPDGAWLAPNSIERWDDEPTWDARIDRSVDGGSTWDSVPVPLDRARLRGAGVIQPGLWHADKRVHALARSSEGRAYRATSDDHGRTWSSMLPTTLPNNNSALTVVALPSGAVACVHNPVAEDWGSRCPLVVSTSTDHGTTWRTAVVIEDGVTPLDDEPILAPSLPAPEPRFTPADDGVVTDGAGEYSYPSACVIHDSLTVVFAWQRRGIVEARVPIESLA